LHSAYCDHRDVKIRSIGSWSIIIVLGSVAIAFVHLAIERFRWQMIPAYFLVATCACWFLLPAPAMFSAPMMLALLAVWLWARSSASHTPSFASRSPPANIA